MGGTVGKIIAAPLIPFEATASGISDLVTGKPGDIGPGFFNPNTPFGHLWGSSSGGGSASSPAPSSVTPNVPSAPSITPTSGSSPYTSSPFTTQVPGAASSMPGLTGGNTNSGLGANYNIGSLLGGVSGMQPGQTQGASQVIGGIMGTDPYGTQIPLNNIPSTLAGNPSTGAIAPQTLQQILSHYINGQIAPTGYGMFDTGWRG